MCVMLFEETSNSPMVKMDDKRGSIEIQGKSTLPDPMNFYSILLDQISHLPKNKLQILNIRLSYINTGSTKWMLYIFKQIEKMAEPLNSIEINWYFEEDDESMAMTGEDYRSILKIPFHLIPEKIIDN